MSAQRRLKVLSLLVTLLVTAATSGLGWAQSLCAADVALTPIAAIQGPGRRSPLQGEMVTTQGVVTGVFTQPGSYGGFFLQDPVGDGSPLTSDGIFVRLIRGTPLASSSLTPGDRIRVRGKVRETSSLTQLDLLEALEVCGYAGLVPATSVSLPLPKREVLENYEGMLISLAGPLTVTEVFNLGRYGEISLADQRLYQPNNGQPDSDRNDLRRLLVNDGNRLQNPKTTPFLEPDGTVRVGDRLASLTGILVNDGFDVYRLEPLQAVALQRTNPRTPQPAAVGGRLKVASFNVKNFFTTLGDRGADNAEELERQKAKLLSALLAIDADLLGLVEIENNGMKAAQTLADALNDAFGRELYAVMPDPASGVGDDRIKQAVLYRPDKLELIGSASDPSAVHERPPLAATFREVASGKLFTVIVVHFKSKGGCPAAGDTDEGYGCWNLRRSAQAQAVVDFAARIAAATGDPDVLILGDLNSYRLEPPLDIFAAAGFTNMDILIPPEERYTYVFFGEAGTLDYALASTSLAGQVSGFSNWHINSDEPPALDYNTEFNPPGLYHPYPYRSSDHDPVILGIDLR